MPLTETQRSIFTDKGPIAKPPLVLLNGTGAQVLNPTDVRVSTVSFNSNVVGRYLRLTSSLNGDTYRIVSLPSSNTLRLDASFSVPDTNLPWEIFDPRNGQIADDPSDVTVKVNGTPVTAQAVKGLLGQIVLANAPAETDDVKVTYSWVNNPTVDIRGLNSNEFCLNNWNRDVGQVPNLTQHNYRYNNVLVDPSSYVASDVQATLKQPLQRDLLYRAYERKYTAVLNDPTLLRLNTPIHKVAYPPLNRQIDTVSIQYNGDYLPELDLSFPWQRNGSGTASISSGNLLVGDNTTGNFPAGKPIFWTRSLDLTYEHAFALTWRFTLLTAPILNGVWTGIAVGWSDQDRCFTVGYLKDGSNYKIGFLKKGSGNNPASLDSWFGGIDVDGNATGLPVQIDPTITHSYRAFRGQDGTVRVYIDGGVQEILRATEDQLSFLYELNDPFSEVQGAFFGSLSLEATNTSLWDFFRYLILPVNPVQTAPTVNASYEGNTLPEVAAQPWTPIGYHGVETIQSGDYLLLDNTSATDPTLSDLGGLVDGDFRGFMRLEPLLNSSTDYAVDAKVQVRTFTHGISSDAVALAVDDGTKFIQLSLLAGSSSPKISYPGRTTPEEALPIGWSSAGGAASSMVGRVLRISDTTVSDGLVYFAEDGNTLTSPDRILSASLDYILEFRVKVISSTATDLLSTAFAGVTSDTFDGSRSVGLMFREQSGVRYVAFHSDGSLLGSGSQFIFDWRDGAYHTYRLVKSTTGDLVSLFIDSNFIGSFAYSSFQTSSGTPTVSFGTATPNGSSLGALSVTDWAYVNVWRINNPAKYLGVWKGFDQDSLLGYHLPTKIANRLGRSVLTSTLSDNLANFSIEGVVAGDQLIVDGGPNRGVYEVATVLSATTLTITPSFPVPGDQFVYRIADTVNWSNYQGYRIVKEKSGKVEVSVEGTTKKIRLDYEVDLPKSHLGLWGKVSTGIPSVSWGAFDATNLSQTSWDYVRYYVTSSVTEQRSVPHHMVLNQRNVMASPEHLRTTIPHSHTDYWSSSTGIPDLNFLNNSSQRAFTKLNEGTPLVPRTQTFEVRRPTPVFESTVGLNRPEDILNSDADFTLTNANTRVVLLVPDDVLYNSLEVIERTTGEVDLLAPMNDQMISMGPLEYQKEVCLEYTAEDLPEASNGGTPWVLESVLPGQVSTSTFSGILTYSVGSTPTTTIYKNATPLVDAISLPTEVSFRFKVLNDASSGTGDTGIRVGFSAFGMTVALAFLTNSNFDRVVRVLNLQNNEPLAELPFDYLDGDHHLYRIVKDPTSNLVQLFIEE